MKVRIGIGIGLGPFATPGGLAAAIGPIEAAGIDSLWLSEVVYGDLVAPLAGMAYTLARTSRLKVGTGVAVLPGRHPVLVAKELASLAALAPRRVLPVFGLRRRVRRIAGVAEAAADPAERVLLRQVLHRDGGERRAAAGQAARHLAGRQRAGRAAPGRQVRRRLARQLPDPGRGAGGARADSGSGRGGRARDRPGPFRRQPRGRRDHAGPRQGYRAPAARRRWRRRAGRRRAT